MSVEAWADSRRYMNNTAEAELLARCQRGDSAAWDELFDLHYAATGRFVFQLGYDFTREDVEEICQEAFLSAIRHLRSFRGNSQFQTWLFRIAANKARDFRQRQQAVKRGGGHANLPLYAEKSDGNLPIDPPSSAPGPDAALINTETMAMLGRALEQLDECSRQLIELRYFADLSYDEIARSMSLPPKTVSSRLSRGLGKLEHIFRRIFSDQGSTRPLNSFCAISALSHRRAVGGS